MSRSSYFRRLAPLALTFALTCCGDGDKPKPTQAAEPKASAAPTSTPAAPPKKSGPPGLTVTGDEVKVGFEIVLMDKPDSAERLGKALEEHRSELSGKELTVLLDRKAKLPWIQALFAELVKAGATAFVVKTDSRPEFPKELKLTPAGSVKDPPPCTVVTSVLADRGTAVWKIAGGTATKNVKGFAGPDLTSTAGTLEKFGRACKDSTRLYFSGAEGIEWGLLYDLAASATKLEKTSFTELVLLPKVPVAGRKVDVSG
jgi:hypothetical protein